MRTHALFVIRLFSLSVLFQVFLLHELPAQPVKTGDFFEGRKTISGIVANPMGNRPMEVDVTQSWELVQQDRVCCGKTTQLPLYARSTALEEAKQKEILAKIGSHFPARGLEANTLTGLIGRMEKSNLRWNNREDLPFPDELLEWKTEDPNHKTGLLAAFTQEQKSYQAPPCECMNITRYQLRTDYTFTGGNMDGKVQVRQYSHIYHEATLVTAGDCPDTPICNALKRGLKAVSKSFPRDVNSDSDVAYTPRGTGRTTGHIATISVNNPTDEILYLTIQPFFIPSTNRFQSYVSVSDEVVEIRPGMTSDIPIMGVCTDIHKPPVPSGEAAFPDITSWIPASEAGPVLEPSMVYDPASGDFVRRPDSQLEYHPEAGTYLPKPEFADTGEGPRITYPGTDIPFPVTINPDRDYPQVARMIIEAVLLIDSTYQDQVRKGSIQTPFSSQSARQSEAVRQQLTWMYVAGMTDDPYEKDDFKQQIVKQYESNTNQSFETAPPAAKENVEKGVDQFWGAFELVGVEAKVLISEKKTESSPIRPDQSSNAPKRCVKWPEDPPINTRTGFDLMGDLYRKGLTNKDLVNDSRHRLKNETVLRAEAMLNGLNDALSEALNPIPCQTDELAHTDRPQQFPEFPSEFHLLVDLCADHEGKDHLSDYLAPGSVEALHNWYAEMERALMNMGLSPAIDQSMMGFFDQKIKLEMDRIADAYNEFESKVMAGMELRYNRSRARAKMWEAVTFVATTAVSAATGGTGGAMLAVFVSGTGFVFDQGLQSMGAEPEVASLVSSLVTLSISVPNTMLSSGVVEGIEETVVGGLLDRSINEQARVLTEERVKGYAMAMNMLNDDNWANFVKKLSEDYDGSAIAMWSKNREDLKAAVARSVENLCKIRNSLNRLIDETKRAQERTANRMHSSHWKSLWEQYVSDNFDCCCTYSDGSGPEESCTVRIPPRE